MVRVHLSLPRSCTVVLAAVGLLLAAPRASAQVASLPFSEGFESGSLASYWTVTTTSTGYAQVATSNEPFSGSYHLLMASSVDSSDSIVSADLALDLAGHAGVILEFSMKEFSDEDDDEDGVWISDDGLNWSLVQPLTQDGGIHGYWKTWTIELDPVLLATGMVYTNPFYVRFQWNDNYDIPTDGFAFDEIKLRESGLTQLRLLESSAPTKYGEFGRAVTSVADLDGDGICEMVVGYPVYSSASGQVEVYSGKDSALLSVLAQGSAGDQVGRALATVGDLDGDGYDELLVGAPFNDGVAPDAGAAYVYSSKTGQLLASFAGAAADGEFGFAVAAVPDMDGDGSMELFVGAPKADGLLGTDSGRGFVYSGSDYQLLLTLEGPQAGARAGTSVDSFGDMDGDGVIDLVMGAPLYDLTPALGDKSGAAFCFSGVDGALVRSFLGTEPSSSFGIALAATEDLTGDGLVDLAIGAPEQGPGLLCFFDGATGAKLKDVFGDAAGDHFAASVARAGDLDGDGLPEIVAGTGSPFLSTVGYVRGYSGANLDERVDFQAVGVGTGFGTSVHAIGDLNGDGLADLLIGSLLEALGSEWQAGVVRVVTSAKAPAVSAVVGLHSTLAGEVVVLGTDLHPNLTATIDGVAFPVTFVSLVEARISLPVDLPGGYYSLEVSSDLGSALLPDGLVRYPAIKAPSTLALGDDLTVEIDNGESGAFALAFSGSKFASPVPFESFGWYYGLELNGVWIIAGGAFGPGSTTQSLTIGGTADPSLVGTAVYFQAWMSQSVLGLMGFTDTLTTTIVP